MGKFKKGDRIVPRADKRAEIVKHWNRYWRDKFGDLNECYVAEVADWMTTPSVRIVNKSMDAACASYGPYWSVNRFDLALETTPNTTVQKGDKFRVNRDCLACGYANGDVFVATGANERGAMFFDNDGHQRFILQEDITFVDDNGEPWDHDPRALKIEAGRYYKTRDGRKVGPMKRFDEDNFIETLGDGIVYNADGKRTYVDMPGSDLIAEWTSYSSCAAAEVDNLRDEYGPAVWVLAAKEAKFKVGDRVRFRTNLTGENLPFAGASATIIGTDTAYSWSLRLDDKSDMGHTCSGTTKEGYGRWADSGELELIEDTNATHPIRPGQFVTLQGYVRAIDGKTAHVDIIGPDVPYNRSYPLSALHAA